MQAFSSKLHTYILPTGFAAIIILMISTAWLTSIRIDNTSDTIIKNELQTINTNRSLDIMSIANLEHSHLLVKMVNSSDPFEIDEYIMQLYSEGTRFTLAREKYLLHELSTQESRLLSELNEVITAYIDSINKVIDLLREDNFINAKTIVNTQSLIQAKHIVDIINQLHNAAYDSSMFITEETKKISNEAYKSILGFNIVSILLTLSLMWYLIRKQRKSDSDLSILANTDTLTDLPNRSNFINNINHIITKENNDCFAIIFFDIDYFKSINDNYGHEIGDMILKRFSTTIANAISPQDVLSRFGGDEFVLLLKNIKHRTDAVNFVKALNYELDTSYRIDDNEIFVSTSIGASTYPHDGNNAKELLKNADIAMYAAKQSGRNCHQFFSIENSKKLEREHTLSHALQTVLKNNNKENQLFLVYQPLVNINDNNFNECEALIRWKDKDGNNINTAEFIEIAERSNLIEKINLFVIEEACKQQYQWQQEGITNIRININLSGNKRIFDKLLRSLLDNLGRYDLRPDQFGIELTERTMHEVSEDTTEDLSHFRDLGMKIAIDDFGTGYSSLSYLKDLPITTIKIDQVFISGLPNEKVDVALVKAIITLAHSLEFDVIAEGVETEEQFEFLKQCKCNIAQGYLLHKPLSSKDITQLKLVA